MKNKSIPGYSSWVRIRQACNNPKHPDYKYIGNKGIQVCKRWDSFSKFLEDLGPRPTGFYLIRKDLTKSYTPDNCIWSTNKNNKTTKGYKYKIKVNKQIPGYKSWVGMRQRCYNIRDKNFKYYGGRGIKVCERWDDFSNFIEDLGLKPENHSLERLDVNGHYNPTNCMWIHKSKQPLNQRDRKDQVYLTYNGITKKLTDWSRELNINKSTLYYRKNNGWSDTDTIEGR